MEESFYTSAEQELIKSFQNLVLNTSGNLRCIEAYQSIINGELDRLSDASSTGLSPSSSSSSSCPSRSSSHSSTNSHKSDTLTNPLNLDKLVIQFPEFMNRSYIEQNNLRSDLTQCFKEGHGNIKYKWLLDGKACRYTFGKKSLSSTNMSSFPGIVRLKDKINKQFNLTLDSCLVTRYKSHSQGLSLHQDNEEILDKSHPIMVVSVGDTRELEFWDNKSECNGKLVAKFSATEGSLVAMLPGCQELLWHKVPKGPNSQTPPSRKGQIRYALSFRKLKANDTPATSQPIPPVLSTPFKQGTSTLVTSTPAPPPRSQPANAAPPAQAQMSPNSPSQDLKPLANGFMVHPGRLSSLPNTNAPHPLPIVEVAPQLVPLQNSDSPALAPEVSPPSPPLHLILGDSMVKGLPINDPQTVSICKGGIHPEDITQLLPTSQHILDHKQYDSIRTVTLVVGTNALNVPANGRAKPLLDIIFSYEKVIDNLKTLFPNSRIGLYNVLPRSFYTNETKDRIGAFNDIFSRHVVQHFSNVFWIKQYWDFVDRSGYLRQDLYGKDGIHLKAKGKALMFEAIHSFQQSYY